MSPDYWKIGKNSTLYVAIWRYSYSPFFLSFFLLFFLFFSLFSFFFSFFLFPWEATAPQPPKWRLCIHTQLNVLSWPLCVYAWKDIMWISAASLKCSIMFLSKLTFEIQDGHHECILKKMVQFYFLCVFVVCLSAKIKSMGGLHTNKWMVLSIINSKITSKYPFLEIQYGHHKLIWGNGNIDFWIPYTL